MIRGNKPIRGDARSSGQRPSAANADADAESGNDGAGAEQALFALEAMYRRGLLPEDEYARRRAEIEAGKVDPED